MASINASFVDDAIKLFKGAAWGIANHASAVEGRALNNALHAELPNVAQWTATDVMDGIKLLKHAGMTNASDAVRSSRSAAAQLTMLARPTQHPGMHLGELKDAGSTIQKAIAEARDYASFMERVRPDYG